MSSVLLKKIHFYKKKKKIFFKSALKFCQDTKKIIKVDIKKSKERNGVRKDIQKKEWREQKSGDY